MYTYAHHLFGGLESQSDTQFSVELLWTSDRHVAKDIYLTTHKNHKRQTSMTPTGFEPAIPPQKKRAAADLHLRPLGYRD